MSSPAAGLSKNHVSARRFLPLLLLLFVGSGCSALIYEIVWFQMLQLVIGSSAVSLGVLLGSFMGGMCLGSLALPRLISSRPHPLRVYASLELGIGLIGIAVLFGMPAVGRLYLAFAGHGLPSVLLRGAVCAVCLLPPTVLMGATLPAIARWVEATPSGVSWLGFFYGGNIAGAVFGCLLAGFYLLRVHDMATATYVAATINATVALIGFALATRTFHGGAAPEPQRGRATRAPHSLSVYIVIALSGFCALGGEVIWTRLLSLLLGATVYTFSIILAVFLVGLGIGSSAGAFLARRIARPRIALGVCQALVVASIAWAAYAVTQSLPYWPIDPSLSTSPWINFQLDIARCLWGVLPAACFWGASFPLALAAVAAPPQDPGRLVGGVYAANTVGAILGAVGTSMVLIGWVGTQNTHRILIAFSALAALLMFAPHLGPFLSTSPAGDNRRYFARGIAGVFSVLGITVVATLLALNVPKVPWELIAHGRQLPKWIGDAQCVDVREGMNASIAVTMSEGAVLNFHVSGKIEASSEPQDMRLQRMLGHIPALIHPAPRSVLVVGCGAGVTAGSFVLYPEIERIVICEIEPLIPKVVARYFSEENCGVVDDPRVQVVYDDARHYILTAREKFDIITSDPIHPWVKGAATLYTREYFDLCRKHLNPGGIVSQWVPLYQSSPETVKSEFATFFDAFPGGTVWSNDMLGEGYDVVLLGQADATPINIDEVKQRFDRDDRLLVRQSLEEVEFSTLIGLLGTYAGRAADLKPWLKDAEINRDRNLRLQYIAGMGLNSYKGGRIFDEILEYCKFPEDLFVGSKQRVHMLQMLIK